MISAPPPHRLPPPYRPRPAVRVFVLVADAVAHGVLVYGLAQSHALLIVIGVALSVPSTLLIVTNVRRWTMSPAERIADVERLRRRWARQCAARRPLDWVRFDLERKAGGLRGERAEARIESVDLSQTDGSDQIVLLTLEFGADADSRIPVGERVPPSVAQIVRQGSTLVVRREAEDTTLVAVDWAASYELAHA